MKLAPLSDSAPCKVCHAPAPYFGDADFSKAMTDLPRPEVGMPVAYYRCESCFFLFTNAFDAWGQEEFLRHIYNDEYTEIDPDFVTNRPWSCAQVLSGLLQPRKGAIRLMDYGGGRGTFARRMTELGFPTASYDPFFKGEMEPRAGEKFELINCREVIEHTPDPHAFVRDLLRFLADDGAVFLSTATQPPEIAGIGLDWKYAAPRNGHISLFSQRSLEMLWAEYGLKLGFFDANNQLAWRGAPACFACLTGASK
ncbi:MAG TPA: class I SAM-dependent methyltransferase [Burkholderiales bacterium]|jgi:2-polyprenyl-6-hydroxyphenyl methylase/3-demethylubiquinone-9 3-methyltransferase|nr:class I SAM-dependent methyltransferase [Burkholderiales bacterium]